MARSKFYVFLLLLCLCCSCENEEPMSPDMVVEGWIEAGKEPIVMLHKGYVLSATDKDVPFDSVIMEQMVIFGKVVVYDDTDSVVLTGRFNEHYMPPYIYSSVYMRGVEGKKYTIKVHYKDYDVSATTTIPKKATFDSICVYKQGNKMKIRGYMSDVKCSDKFLVIMKSLEDFQFKLTPLGTLTGEQAIDGHLVVDVRNVRNRNDSINYTNDTTNMFPTNTCIKIARVGDREYDFWSSYIAQSQTQGVLFMSVYRNIPTNITNGIGCWYGMGATEYVVNTEQEKTYRYVR